MWTHLIGAWHWWILLPWNVWLDYTDKVVKIVAVIVGGAWAYAKFIKGRVFHTRLEPNVTARHFRRDQKDFLLAVVKLKNVGASKVDIQQKGTALRIFGCGVFGPAVPGKPVAWTRTHTLSVFERHGWIEGSETIDDTVLVALPPNLTAVKLELRIVANKIAWSAGTMIDLPGVTG
jgi:hypothetical protein